MNPEKHNEEQSFRPGKRQTVLDHQWARSLICAIGAKAGEIKKAIKEYGYAELSMEMPEGEPRGEFSENFVWLNDNENRGEMMAMVTLASPSVAMSYFLNGEIAGVIRMILIKAWAEANEELLVKDYKINLSGLDYMGAVGEIARMSEPLVEGDANEPK